MAKWANESSGRSHNHETSSDVFTHQSTLHRLDVKLVHTVEARYIRA